MYYTALHTMPRHGIDFLDTRLAKGSPTFASHELRSELGISGQSASNLLARWRREGLVDRVARGRYAIRQIGLLGTRAASEDVALAVTALIDGGPHRIAYHSALDFHGLLVRPVRTIQIASPRPFNGTVISGDLPLRIVRESEGTVRLGSEPAGHGARVSGLERALLDAATRPDLVGGYLPLAEALARSQPDSEQLLDLANALGASAARRRIGSLADRLALPGLAGQIDFERPPAFDLDLDPGLKHLDTAFRDRKWRMRWPVDPARVAEELAQ